MNRGTRPVAPAVDVLAWAWVLAAVLPGSLDPDWSARWTPAVAVAVATAAYRALAVLRPAAVVLRGVVWAVGAAVALAALGVTRPAPPELTVLSLSGASAAVAGLTLAAPAAVATVLALQAWHAAWLLGAWSGTASATAPATLAESVLVTATSCLTAVLVARAIRTGRQRIDGLVAGLLADRRTLRADEARDRARRAARADLHDTVLTTLSAVGAGWTRRADPAELRAEFGRSAAALHGPLPGPDAGVPLLEALRSTAAAPRFAGLRVDVGGEEVDVPAPVAAALRLATGEALTNVAKHAGVDRARVRVRSDGAHVEVTVIDEGQGVRPGPTPGLGLSDSVVGRMTAVGGEGLVRTAADRGTAVVLRAPLVLATTAVPLPSLWPDRGPRTAAVWLTGGTLLTGVAGVALAPGPVVGVAAAWVLCAVAVVVLAVLVGTRRFPAWLTLLVVLTGPAVVLLAGIPAGGCTALARPPLSVALGAVAAGLLLAVVRPRREALLGLGATLAAYGLTGWSAADAGPSCTAAVVAVACMHAGQVGACVVVVSALRRRAADGRATLLTDQHVADRHQDADALAGERGRLLPAVRRAVADTLDGLARGELDPRDDGVRARCRRDARLVRSLLTQGPDVDPLLHGLVELAVAVRADGVDLAVRGSLPAGSVPGRTADDAVRGSTAVICRLVEGGWRGEVEATVLATGGDVVLTLLAHGVGALASPVVDPTWGTWEEPRVELVDGSLWLSTRAALDPEESP